MLNTLFIRSAEQTAAGETVTAPAEYKDSSYRYNHQVDDILAYINQNISQPITVEQLAGQFYLSESYICRISNPPQAPPLINTSPPAASVSPRRF